MRRRQHPRRHSRTRRSLMIPPQHEQVHLILRLLKQNIWNLAQDGTLSWTISCLRE